MQTQIKAEQDAHLQRILQHVKEVVTALKMNGSHAMRLARAINLITGKQRYTRECIQL
jgi:hypothetical protein